MSANCPHCGYFVGHNPHCPAGPGRISAEAEQLRQEHHHDIVWCVVQELVRDAARSHLELEGRGVQERIACTARDIADRVYPPPKEEP